MCGFLDTGSGNSCTSHAVIDLLKTNPIRKEIKTTKHRLIPPGKY